MTSIPNIIQEEFAAKFPTSMQRYKEAVDVFPGGVTHDGRYLKPFPVYISHGKGAHKWDLGWQSVYRLLDGGTEPYSWGTVTLRSHKQ